MSSRPNDAVSIQLRNLEEESDGETSTVKESDGETSTVKESLPDKAKRWWDTLFPTICVFAVFIDPLFCYIFVIRREEKEKLLCIDYDEKSVWTCIGLRIGIDVFYIIDVIFFLCGICKQRKGKIFGLCCCKPKTEQRPRVISLKQVTKRRCWLPILLRILVAIPIPGVIHAFKAYPVLFQGLIVLFQYLLRILLIFPRWRSFKETTIGIWRKQLMDFIPFIFASHIFGAFWYLFAVVRLFSCLDPHGTFSERKCYDTQSQLRCPIDNEDKTTFDFGIFFYAYQSKSTSSSSLIQRMMQSFWWALRNLSSFGSNLPTSEAIFEILFSILISIYGMILFLLYLNARVKVGEETTNLCMESIYAINH